MYDEFKKKKKNVDVLLATLRCRADQPVRAVLPRQRKLFCCRIFVEIVFYKITILSFSILRVVVKHRIRQICPILPLSGRPPLVYVNPRLPSVQRDWFVIGGEKAPDGGLGQLGPIRNRLLSPGGRLHAEGPAPLFLDSSKDHPGNFGVLPHNV